MTAEIEAELADMLGAALLAAGRLVEKTRAVGPVAIGEYKKAVTAEAAITYEVFKRLPVLAARAVVGMVSETLRKERPLRWKIR